MSAQFASRVQARSGSQRRADATRRGTVQRKSHSFAHRRVSGLAHHRQQCTHPPNRFCNARTLGDTPEPPGEAPIDLFSEPDRAWRAFRRSWIDIPEAGLAECGGAIADAERPCRVSGVVAPSTAAAAEAGAGDAAGVAGLAVARTLPEAAPVPLDAPGDVVGASVLLSGSAAVGAASADADADADAAAAGLAAAPLPVPVPAPPPLPAALAGDDVSGDRGPIPGIGMPMAPAGSLSLPTDPLRFDAGEPTPPGEAEAGEPACAGDASAACALLNMAMRSLIDGIAVVG